MTRLICIKNPAIFISAPDELVSEVGGNCWQIGGPQPLTYPKHLWKKESQPSFPSNLDEAAQRIAYDVCKQLPNGEEKDGIVYYAILAAIAGAEWMAGQGYTKEGIARPDDCEIWVNIKNTDIKYGDKVVVQIRKK